MGLLGEVGAFLVVAVTAAGTESLVVESVSYDLLATFSALFGIPLSATALATGVLLGVGGKWGVLRSRWVGIKLLLLASVIVVGAAVLGPSVAEMRTGSQGLEARIVAGATWDVLALTLATGLSVYKPGGRRVPRRRGLPSNPR